MASVTVRRRLEAAPAAAWGLLCDPHNLPRWWPETVRVEGVEGRAGARRSRFTQVIGARSGAPVRLDYRCVEATQGRRLVWEQRVEGTPFERFLRQAQLELRVEAAEGGCEVALEGRRKLRGVSRLGGPLMSRGTRSSLERAMDGIERALTGPLPGE